MSLERLYCTAGHCWSCRCDLASSQYPYSRSFIFLPVWKNSLLFNYNSHGAFGPHYETSRNGSKKIYIYNAGRVVDRELNSFCVPFEVSDAGCRWGTSNMFYACALAHTESIQVHTAWCIASHSFSISTGHWPWASKEPCWGNALACYGLCHCLCTSHVRIHFGSTGMRKSVQGASTNDMPWPKEIMGGKCCGAWPGVAGDKGTHHDGHSQSHGRDVFWMRHWAELNVNA